MSVLIWVQTVCIGYQQTQKLPLARKELIIYAVYKSFPIIFYEGTFIATVFLFISKCFGCWHHSIASLKSPDGQVEPIKSICQDKWLICDHFNYINISPVNI